MAKADPRMIAYLVLGRVAQGAYADLALDAELGRQSGLDPRDRGLATELVYGILRRQGRLDFALGQFCRQPLPKLEEKVLRLLRLGAYQLLCLDRIPPSAAVNTTVELARQQKLERATGFINGILRALERGRQGIPWPDPNANPLDHLQVAGSLPGWLAKRWLKEFGAAGARSLAAALGEAAPLTIRVNTLSIDRVSLLARLEAQGQAATPCHYAPEGIVLESRAALSYLAADEFQVQDEASMLIAHLLGARPGERLLDTCAAPGGKTTHLAALTGNQADIVALDVHSQRVKLVEEGTARLGCRGVSAHTWDMTLAPDFLPTEGFDRVLVDAPCSGLGVLRRNPELRWRRTAHEIASLAGVQLRLLDQASRLVRPGGVLLYSLCTFTPEETEGVVQTFLAQHAGFSRQDLRAEVPGGWQELCDDRGALRTLPHLHHGMDAFYAVRFQRQV